MAVYNFIDVSSWQGKIDWAKVKKAGIVGAIIRYADGTTIDSRFDENMTNAKAAGLHVGCYIFSRATSKAAAESEATRLYNAAKKYSPDMPLYIDLEVAANKKYADTVATAFLNKMKALGGYGGVYANLNWWNNYLADTAKNYSASPFWIAQYYDKITHKNPKLFGMWQYSSSGKVNGISGKVDMDWCYVEYWKNSTPPTTPEPDPEPPKPVEPVKVGYDGEFPSTKLNKTNAEVKAEAIRWATWIAGDNRFHYGYTNKHGSSDPKKWNPNAHHNGCYFCGTNTTSGGRSKAGITDYQFTYCCNPFVGAAWAHGGGIPKAMELCQKGSSWNFEKGTGYDASSLFDNLGKPAKSALQAGDVLCSDSHVALYIGNGKVAEAASGDDNVKNSTKWNNSIHTTSLTDSKYGKFKRVHRYNSSVNTTSLIRYGEVSKRVELLQKFLVWYGIELTADGIFGDKTLSAVKKFQQDMGIAVDGIVGNDTIAKMQEVKK